MPGVNRQVQRGALPRRRPPWVGDDQAAAGRRLVVEVRMIGGIVSATLPRRAK